MRALSDRVELDTDFESVVRLYWSRVFRFILASVRMPDVAETLTRDCFLKAHRSAAGFRNECSVDTWLMQIAVNLVRDYGRNQRLQFWRRAQKCEAGGVDRRQHVQPAAHAAAQLPERQRTVFLLRFVEDMSLLEIVEATGMKEGTVKTHLFRALEAMRKHIGIKP